MMKNWPHVLLPCPSGIEGTWQHMVIYMTKMYSQHKILLLYVHNDRKTTNLISWAEIAVFAPKQPVAFLFNGLFV